MQSYTKQCSVALLVSSSVMAAVAHYTWPGPSIPKLLSPEALFLVTKDEISWISSIFFLGSGAGAICAIFLTNSVGRKLTLNLLGIPYIISSILIMCAQSALMLLIARFIAGWAHGVTMAVLPIYLGEIASVRIRGLIGSILVLSMVPGTTYVTAIGSYTSIIFTAGALVVFPIVLLLSYFWVPETPYFYLMKQRYEDAMESLKFLRGTNDFKDIQQEFDEIQKSVLQDQQNKGNFKEIFKVKGNLKGLIIIMVTISATQFSGEPVISSYMQEIFENAEGVLDPKISSIILNVLQVIPAFMSAAIVDKVGRRLLLLLPLFGVTITNGIMACYFFLKDFTEIDMTVVSWIPVVTLIAFYMLYMSGIGSVPDVLFGELFPMNIKALAIGIINTYTSVLIFTIVKLYEPVIYTFGQVAPFSIFSLASITFCIIIYFILPETKGKTLSEIQCILNNNLQQTSL